jgi:hypothetical protein
MFVNYRTEITRMNSHDSQIDVVFSYAQASAMLPLLRLIVADISLAHRDLTERKIEMHRIARLRENRKNRIDKYYLDEIEVTREDLKIEEAQLQELILELESLGVVLQSARDGIVVFPAIIDDQAAYYCWKMGDAQITSWHFPGETFADRKPLDLDSLAKEDS